MSDFKPTHTYRPSGWCEKPCEIIQLTKFLATIRVRCNAYFEPERFEVRAVSTSTLEPLVGDARTQKFRALKIHEEG
jgi:hypothetical protein